MEGRLVYLPSTPKQERVMTEIETQHLATVIDRHTGDMTGKVVAITGTTSGTGYVCARELAKLGARVLLLNRESERSKNALESLRASVPGGQFESIQPRDARSQSPEGHTRSPRTVNTCRSMAGFPMSGSPHGPEHRPQDRPS